MKNFFSCIIKDLKIFGRSPFSAFVAVVLPLLLVLAVSTMFGSGGLHGISIAVYSDSYTDITNSIVKSLESQNYFISKKDSLQRCSDSVKDGTNQVCIIFPAGLSNEGNNEPVTFYVDSSRMNIVYILTDEIKTYIGVKSSEISVELINEIILQMEDAKSAIEVQRGVIAPIKADIGGVAEKAIDISEDKPSTENILISLKEALYRAEFLNQSEDRVTAIKREINNAIDDVGSLESSLNTYSGKFRVLKNDTLVVQGKLDKLYYDLEKISVGLKYLRVNQTDKIASPIRTEIKSVLNDSSNWDYIFPTLLSLLVLFCCTILSSVLALKEKQSKAFFRNSISPTSDFTFLIALYVSSMLILLVQLIVLFSGLALLTNAVIVPMLGRIAIIVFLSGSVFTCLGLFIGHLFKSEEAAIIVAISLIFLMMFFSSIFVPIESVLGQYQSWTAYNPFVTSSTLLKQVMLFDAPLNEIGFSYILLSSLVVLFFGLALVARQITKRFV